jgi:hypothetical protein
MKKAEKETLNQLGGMEDFLRDCPVVRDVHVDRKIHHIRGQRDRDGRIYFKIMGLDGSGIRIRLGFGSWYRNVTVYVGEPGTRPTTEEVGELERYLKRYQI